MSGKGGGAGVYSPVNLVAYHYAGNNPLVYTDPSGNETILSVQLVGGMVFVNGNIDAAATRNLSDPSNSIGRMINLNAAQNRAMNAPVYQQGGGGWYPENETGTLTYCNLALFGIARALGVDSSKYAADENSTPAGAVVDRMKAMVKSGGLVAVSGETAQALANSGLLVVAGWKAENGSNAHVATVAQGKYSEEYGAKVGNVGITNGSKAAYAAFGVYKQDSSHPKSTDEIQYFFDPSQLYESDRKFDVEQVTKRPNK